MREVVAPLSGEVHMPIVSGRNRRWSVGRELQARWAAEKALDGETVAIACVHPPEGFALKRRIVAIAGRPLANIKVVSGRPVHDDPTAYRRDRRQIGWHDHRTATPDPRVQRVRDAIERDSAATDCPWPWTPWHPLD